MGIGFIVTIVLLASLLGLFSKQVLSPGQKPNPQQPRLDMNDFEFDMTDLDASSYPVQNQEKGHHPHAM